MLLLVPRVALSSSIHPAHPLRALQHHPSYSRARCPCVAIYIKRWSVASRSAETRASVAEGRSTEKEKALGKGGRVEREREREETCAPPPLALSLVFSRDRQRRRSSENTRIRNATAGQYAPTFRATKKRFPRSLPFDREPLAFVHAFVPSFPGYLPNFRIFRLALSLSLSHLFREFSCRSCGMNGNGRHARVYGHVLFSIYLCGLTWSKERPRANWFLSVLSGRGRTRHGNLVTRGGDEIKNRESNFLAPRNYIFFPA